MSAKPSAFEQERLNHINYLMDELHGYTSEVYECLVDRDFDELPRVVNKLISKLNELKTSVEDEI